MNHLRLMIWPSNAASAIALAIGALGVVVIHHQASSPWFFPYELATWLIGARMEDQVVPGIAWFAVGAMGPGMWVLWSWQSRRARQALNDAMRRFANDDAETLAPFVTPARFTAEQLTRRILDRRLVSRWRLSGCLWWQIRRLERRIGRRLPALYRDVLRRFGLDAGYLFVGEAFFYPEVLRMNEPPLLSHYEEDVPDLRVPDDAIIFQFMQSDGLAWIRTSEGDDPPVHRLHAPLERVITCPCLSGYLMEQIEGHAASKRYVESIERKWGS